MLKRVYDINLNYLGVNPPLTPARRGIQEYLLRSQEGSKEEERGIEGESFLVA
ncbi:MAG: hypothetical protein F6K17_13185 [Okeania sp. SIO3C4]|nr:hypothetical protein [Okeania sp. SIO3C4]